MKRAAAPMMAVQRRIEARIGALLGEATAGQRTDLEPSLMSDGSEWWAAVRGVPEGSGVLLAGVPAEGACPRVSGA